jgi:hypothetical protein
VQLYRLILMIRRMGRTKKRSTFVKVRLHLNPAGRMSPTLMRGTSNSMQSPRHARDAYAQEYAG